MDFSHIVAAGGDPLDYLSRHRGRIAHVHLRDAVPGNINLSIGNGQADFAAGLEALAADGYTGHFSLELETRDVTHDERPAAAAKAGQLHHRPHLTHPHRTNNPRSIMTTIQRTAVLTGATSDRGIGITTARRYASQGWAVVILDLDGEKSAKVAAEIGNEFTVPAFGHAVDVDLRGLGDRRLRRRRRRGRPPATCPPSAPSPTSPASPPRCRSWRPPWSSGTRSWPSTPPAPTWSPRPSCPT